MNTHLYRLSGRRLLRLLIAAVILLSVSVPGVQASLHASGKTYLELDTVVTGAPPVLEYFSFYCPACYGYDNELKVTERMKSALPEGTRLTQYHAHFMGPLGDELTRAWSVAILMNIEDKMKPLLFEAVQIKQSVHSWTDIRQVFTDAGVQGAEFDAAWESFGVLSMTEMQNKLAQELKLTGIPAVYINGKYQINPAGMNASSVEAFVNDYIDEVRYLL
ncbi:DsbA family protein [Yokenella regensburgei]|uniref:DsbA family protein n=1 Tax=Yokenella regensburgei TaxID=158877 RepID=UPI0027D9ACB2|nr:DsbA family protein [Yokenella regensburgei]MDQ4429027.1 DsbA family protein [Yokenella regensburgei]